MDNHIFRSAIGGFNRQDVTEYIERTQKQAEEAAAALNKQLEDLRQAEGEARAALEERTREKAELEKRLEEMTDSCNNAKSNWESQAQAKEALRRDVAQRDGTIRDMTEENQRLFRQVQTLEEEVQELRRLLGLVQRNLEELSMELGEPVWEEGGGMPPESMGRNLEPEQDADPQLEEKQE